MNQAVPQPVQATGPSLTPQQGIPLQQTSSGSNSQSTPSFNVPGFIQAAQKQGIPDDQIVNALHQKGLVPNEAIVTNTGETGIKGLALGAEKGALTTLNNISKAGQFVLNNTAGRLSNLLTGNGFKPTETADLNNYADLQTHGTTEKVGKVLENIGEFFLPTAAEGALGKTFEGGVNALKIGNTATKVGKFLAQPAASALIGGTQVGFQEGSVKSGVEGAATFGATSAALRGVGILAKAGLEKIQPYLEELNLKATPAKAAKYAASRVEGGPSRFEEAVQVGTNTPGITPQAKLDSTLSTINKAESSLDSVIQSPAMQEVAGYVPTKQVVKAFEDAAKGSDVTSDVSRQLLKEGQAALERNPDYTPLSFLQDQKKAWGMKGFKEGGEISNTAKAAFQDVYKGLVEDSLNKVDARIPVPDEMKALFPNSAIPNELPVHDFNKLYGAVLDYKKLLKGAMSKSEVGFVKRLAADFVGGLVGHTVGGPIGAATGAAVADQVARNAPISAARTIAGKAATKAAPYMTKRSILVKPISGVLTQSKSK